MRSILLGCGAILFAVGLSSCGGGNSNSSTDPANPDNPQPTLISFSPFNAQAGGGSFALTLYGSNFASSSEVLWNGSTRTTTFVNSNQLTAQISAGDIASAGIAEITVSSPPPGGGTSHIFRFRIESTAPIQRFLYVANSSENTITGYSIDANTGSLVGLPGSPFMSGPEATNAGLIFGDLFGKFDYVQNNATIGCKGCESLSTLVQGAAGALTPAAGSPLPNSSCPTLGDPTGNIVYRPVDSGLGTMLIDANSGALIQIADSPGLSDFPTARNPTGTLLYGPDFNGVWAGSTSNTGGPVTVVTGSPFGGNRATAVAVDPAGKFLFAVQVSSAGDDSSALATFTIDPTTGVLTLINSIQYVLPVSLSNVLVHPTGRFLYVSDDGGNSVQAFTIDASGTLTAIAGSPFSTGPSGINPQSMATDPEGRFLYVANFYGGEGGSISAFGIDANSGVLTPIAGSPFLTGSGPTSIVITPQ